MKRTFKIPLIILASLLITNCIDKTPQITNVDTDTYSIMHNELNRTFILHVPEDYNPKNRYSLCFVFHGGNGTAQRMVDKNFTQKAKKLNFIMVYPNGINGKWNFNKNANNIPLDVDFVSKLIKSLKKEYNIDSSRVYATGVSMGGVMAYSLASNIPQELAGIASVSSTMSNQNKGKKKQPLPILHIHAKDDPVILYEKPGYSGLHSVNVWRKINQNNTKPKESLIMRGINKKRWSSSSTSATTTLISHETGGHGSLPFTVDFILDFFYNTPPRENKISFNLSSLKDFYFVNQGVEIALNIDNISTVKNITFLINGEELITNNTSLEYFQWIPTKEGKYKLEAFIELKNGKKVYSPISLDILVIKPFINEKFSAKSTSNENKGLVISNIIDGDFKTRWASKYSDNQNFIIDMGDIKEISSITILWEDAYAKKYNIELSDNGENWSTLSYSKTDSDPEFINFAKKKIRYIKFTGKERATSWGYSIFEILVHE